MGRKHVHDEPVKPKNLIILAAFALLILTVGFFHFWGHKTQAAAQNRVTVVSDDVPRADEPEDEGVCVWIVKGSVPADRFVFCEIEYTDGRVETVPLDGCYELDDRFHFLVSLFPSTGDWGATVRLCCNRPDQTPAGPGSDREVVTEKVAPQLPADRPEEGFVWRGEELPGCNVWRWEVYL
jgi:hypothetical protein